MAFDVLQRWHENNHIDTSGYRITPYRRTPIPRYSALPAIALALDKILPELDPLRIAQRRLAMEKLRMETDPRRRALLEAQLQAQTQLLPLQLQAQRAQLQALKTAYDTPGAINPATGKPWTESEKLQRDKLKRKSEWDKSFDQYNDSARAYDNGAHPAHLPDQTSATPPVVDPYPDAPQSGTQIPFSPAMTIPDVQVGDLEDEEGDVPA